jgi:hypothetical protein
VILNFDFSYFCDSDWHYLLILFGLVVQRHLFLMHQQDTNQSVSAYFTAFTILRCLHTMPDDDAEVQTQIFENFGVCPCLWQIRVVCTILACNDVSNYRGSYQLRQDFG